MAALANTSSIHSAMRLGGFEAGLHMKHYPLSFARLPEVRRHGISRGPQSVWTLAAFAPASLIRVLGPHEVLRDQLGDAETG